MGNMGSSGSDATTRTEPAVTHRLSRDAVRANETAEHASHMFKAPMVRKTQVNKGTEDRIPPII